MGIPGAVPLEGRTIAVVTKAVGLGDHAPVAPEEVDLVWPEPGVHLGLGKAVAAAEGEEEPLEFAAG